MNDKEKEIQEAIVAGNSALEALNYVDKSISTARRIGCMGYAWRRTYQWLVKTF